MISDARCLRSCDYCSSEIGAIKMLLLQSADIIHLKISFRYQSRENIHDNMFIVMKSMSFPTRLLFFRQNDQKPCLLNMRIIICYLSEIENNKSKRLIWRMTLRIRIWNYQARLSIHFFANKICLSESIVMYHLR